MPFYPPSSSHSDTYHQQSKYCKYPSSSNTFCLSFQMNGTTWLETEAPNVVESGVSESLGGDEGLTTRQSACSSTTPHNIRTPDSQFYFSIVVFGVGESIFRVPRQAFEVPGTVFEAIFSIPLSSSDTDAVEGLSDEHPIVLDGIEEDHFRGFLGALYPFAKVVTYNDWVGALHLATMWEFKEVREKAISGISSMLAEKTSVEIVLLAKKYRVVHWLRDAYTRLVEQRTLTLEDVRSPFTLDSETALKIFYIRSAMPYNIQAHKPQCPYCAPSGIKSISVAERKALFEDVFRAEFDTITPTVHHIDPLLPGKPQVRTVSGKKKSKKSEG
ncbi:unnamed protein product [Cyclocybe aegerita]|uniref:BTB domain-containing protein n=1 Tax=Cyclocybe aegerita TaxID=1973307 RepID=A0A8S0XQZ1_CYCAE|nr:unnamed protein product [Cyclocybe aegerita]